MEHASLWQKDDETVADFRVRFEEVSRANSEVPFDAADNSAYFVK